MDALPRLLAHLAEAGFTRMPTPHAALFRGGDLVALITQFLPGALDGWDWGVDALLAGEADFGAELGTLAAELHAALATPTSVMPSPVKVMAGAEDWKTAVDEAVTAADDEWVRSIAPLLAADLAPADLAAASPALEAARGTVTSPALEAARGAVAPARETAVPEAAAPEAAEAAASPALALGGPSKPAKSADGV
jgi:maltokinase